MLERPLTEAEETEAEAQCEEILASWADRIALYNKDNPAADTLHMQGLLEDLAYEAACISVISRH